MNTKKMWMEPVTHFMQHVQSLIDKAMATQQEAINQAGAIVAATLRQQGIIYAFGTGHSHMLAEELFYRAGGLARVYPILPEELMLHKSALQSTEWERREGYAATLLSQYPCTPVDCMLIASNSGCNAVTVEMAMEARRLGMAVIALTNMAHSQARPSRHSSGQKLFELAHVVLDNQGCPGDAAMWVEALQQNIAPTSTILGALLLQAMVISAVHQLLEKGHRPDMLASANWEEAGEVHNEALLERLKPVINVL